MWCLVVGLALGAGVSWLVAAPIERWRCWPQIVFVLATKGPADRSGFRRSRSVSDEPTRSNASYPAKPGQWIESGCSAERAERSKMPNALRMEDGGIKWWLKIDSDAPCLQTSRSPAADPWSSCLMSTTPFRARGTITSVIMGEVLLT